MSLVESFRKYPLPRQLAFPASEFEARLTKVRAYMVQHDLDVLLVGNSGNLCWLTGYETVMPSGSTCAIVPAAGEISVVCPDLEVSCLEIYTEVSDFLVEDWHSGRDVTGLIAERLGQLAGEGSRVGIELGKIDTYSSPSFDYSTVLSLQERLPGRTWIDTTWAIPKLRLIKSQLEIDAMRKAGEYTSAGLEAAIQTIAPGVTDNDLAATIYEVTISAGSEFMPIDPMVIAGERAGHMPFLTHRNIPLKPGDAVYLESSGASSRYSAPLMRSASVGKATDATRRLADMALGVVENLISEIRPGRIGDDVARSAAGPVENLPEDTFFPGTFGYTCGLGIQPTWTEYPGYLAFGSDFELQQDMTLHLPICLWSPRERTGIGISETIRVTTDGCELITPGTGRDLVEV